MGDVVFYTVCAVIEGWIAVTAQAMFTIVLAAVIAGVCTALAALQWRHFWMSKGAPKEKGDEL